MAKVIAPFKIKGTLDDINFIITKDGSNYARMKGKTGISSEEFKNNPVFDRIRNHGSEWSYCVKKAAEFRSAVKPLFDNAKEGSFAGRVNKLMYEIIKEDTKNPVGKRTLEEGFKTAFLQEICIGFEGNKNRPLNAVLKSEGKLNPQHTSVTYEKFHPGEHLDWPEDATHAFFILANTVWNSEDNVLETRYSDKIILEKKVTVMDFAVTAVPSLKNGIQFTLLYIGFAKKQRDTLKIFHRKHNTVSIIACKVSSADNV